jgi:hypothetical protein
MVPPNDWLTYRLIGATFLRSSYVMTGSPTSMIKVVHRVYKYNVFIVVFFKLNLGNLKKTAETKEAP